MISLDRVLTYAKTQGFRVVKQPNDDGTKDIILVDKKGNEMVLLEGHTEGEGVERDLLDLISAETQP